MKKIIILFSFLLCFFGRSFGQETKKITIIDTIKLTGLLIYDSKKEKIVLNKEVTIFDDLWAKSKVRRMFNKSELVFLDPSILKGILRRQDSNVYEFCKDNNKEKFFIDREKLLYNRYFILPFKDTMFITLTIDKNNFITLKCF